jgi:hypothetical protein
MRSQKIALDDQMGTNYSDNQQSTEPAKTPWVKPEKSQHGRIGRNADTYGSYKGQPLPPPGRDHIIVRTPNPLPAPKTIGSQ